MPIVGDAKTCSQQMLEMLPDEPPPARDGWWSELREMQARYPLRYQDRTDVIMPQRFFRSSRT